jgi:tetratricopeptide (TPR) repeat protein
MRLLVLTLLSTFLLSGTASAQVAEATQAFDKATLALNQGAYTEAIAKFDDAEAEGLASAALYYNRAIAHYRLEQIGEAVRYFRRALAIDPDDARIRHSLSIVTARIEDQFSELPAPIWTRLQRLIVSVVPVNGLIITGLLFYLGLMSLLFVRIKRIAENDWLRRLRYICGTGALLLLFAGFSSALWPPYPSESVVLVDELIVYDQPDADAQVRERVHEGLVVSTTAAADGWTFIQLPNGAQGWTSSEGLGAI